VLALAVVGVQRCVWEDSGGDGGLYGDGDVEKGRTIAERKVFFLFFLRLPPHCQSPTNKTKKKKTFLHLPFTAPSGTGCPGEIAYLLSFDTVELKGLYLSKGPFTLYNRSSY
jgi:hypothetical protein